MISEPPPVAAMEKLFSRSPNGRRPHWVKWDDVESIYVILDKSSRFPEDLKSLRLAVVLAGLFCSDGLSVLELANGLDVTRQRIYQIRNEGLRRLRHQTRRARVIELFGEDSLLGQAVLAKKSPQISRPRGSRRPR
jgi:hypothetical protein